MVPQATHLKESQTPIILTGRVKTPGRDLPWLCHTLSAGSRLPAKASCLQAVSLLSVVNKIAPAMPAPGAEPGYNSTPLPLASLPNRKVVLI